MRRIQRLVPIIICLVSANPISAASSLKFSSRELFRIPFGTAPQTLGSKIENGNFIIPRDFTIDGAGHFYLYDTNNHRIARFSYEGKYEAGFRYPSSADQVFAHADAHENLWLLVSDPVRGIFYGVYDPHGKRIKEGIFSKFQRFRLYVDDESTLHIILSSKAPGSEQRTYIFDEDTLLMKKEKVAAPPEDHHQVRKSDHVFFVDRVPDGSKQESVHVNRVTDENHHDVASIKGSILYVTARGEIYTRVGERQLNIYDVDGSLKGKVMLEGLAGALESIRFDSDGNLYVLDGIPDPKGHYTAEMPGMRLLVWERAVN